MNLLKWRANQLRSRLDPSESDESVIQRIADHLALANAVRDRLIQCNMRLVISIARKFVNPTDSFDEMLSEGTVALMNAVEKFDFDRGFRFSTYAHLSVTRALSRLVKRNHKRRSRQIGLDGPSGDKFEDLSRPAAADREEETQRELLGRLLHKLDRRERLIVRARYALGSHRKRKTCRELGQRLGISKERVRQIEQRAIARIKEYAAEELTDSQV